LINQLKRIFQGLAYPLGRQMKNAFFLSVDFACLASLNFFARLQLGIAYKEMP